MGKKDGNLVLPRHKQLPADVHQAGVPAERRGGGIKKVKKNLSGEPERLPDCSNCRESHHQNNLNRCNFDY